MNLQKYYQTTIKIPENVTVYKKDHHLFFSSPLGQTILNLKKIDPKGTAAFMIDPELKRINIISHSKSYHGLLKSLIKNKIQGISRGFLIYLKIVGIGYRASLENNSLFLKLGYSHDILYKVPVSVKAFMIDPTLICLFGIDKSQVSQVAAKLRDLRKPSVYKGKGIRILNENILLKSGKRK
jgi:large subunit ribosomal protein L6